MCIVPARLRSKPVGVAAGYLLGIGSKMSFSAWSACLYPSFKFLAAQGGRFMKPPGPNPVCSVVVNADSEMFWRRGQGFYTSSDNPCTCREVDEQQDLNLNQECLLPLWRVSRPNSLIETIFPQSIPQKHSTYSRLLEGCILRDWDMHCLRIPVSICLMRCILPPLKLRLVPLRTRNQSSTSENNVKSCIELASCKWDIQGDPNEVWQTFPSQAKKRTPVLGSFDCNPFVALIPPRAENAKRISVPMLEWIVQSFSVALCRWQSVFDPTSLINRPSVLSEEYISRAYASQAIRLCRTSPCRDYNCGTRFRWNDLLLWRRQPRLFSEVRESGWSSWTARLKSMIERKETVNYHEWNSPPCSLIRPAERGVGLSRFIKELDWMTIDWRDVHSFTVG